MAKAASVPARWIVRSAWRLHRGIHRYSGGRLGLWRPRPGRWGTLRLTASGRRTGEPRSVILAYLEDGPNLHMLAMNGWGAGEPVWWLNLQAGPDATVQLRGEAPRPVRARPAAGAERADLWQRWREVDAKLDAYADLRPTETAVVVLEPR